MKNGYIVHGSIVDVTAEQIVVAWPRGRVIIPRRFIQGVTLDAGEEQKIQEQHAPAPATKTSYETRLEAELELPPDPSSFLAVKRPVDGRPAGDQGSPRPLAPAIELGERQELAPTITGSLPLGWSLRREGDAWIVESAPEGETALRARVAGTAFARELNRAAQIALAKEAAENAFDAWDLLDEGYREIGLRQGYELVGRGEEGGTAFSVRQILAWVGSRVWLMSCAWPAEGDAGRAIEWFLQTVEFSQ
jgi:hypothetical protein